LCNRARAFLQSDEFERALEDAEAAVGLQPLNAKTWLRLSQAKYQLNDIGPAADAAAKSRELGCVEPELAELEDKLAKTEQGRYARLRKFLVENGAEVSRLRIHETTPDFRYVAAHRRIQQGETILTIPQSVLILLSDVKKDPIAGQLHRKEVSVNNWTHIAVFLLLERGKGDSFWNPYLDVIPFSTDFPLFYPPEHLEYIKDTPSYGNIKKFA
jgi:tetratricopeptide (TPR) repeat protein